jgi:hypothetical protein
VKINLHGFSNLGIDLYLEGTAHGHDVRVQSSERTDELHSKPDMVINTRGGCAGGDFVDDPPKNLWFQNITQNIEYCRKFPNAKVWAFSSNAAMEPYRTPYAAIKHIMEKIPYENFNYIRVGNLYGKHKRELTFPGRLLKYNPKSLPTNPIVPIPTDWFGKRFFDGHTGAKLWPIGVTSPHQWGEYILGRTLDKDPMTEDRNQTTWLEGLSGVYWMDLFVERIEWYRGKNELPNLWKHTKTNP